ncbi:MAG: alanyl-tRNA editing protein [Actinomycetota bacterium]|nr:alanyl-tRNA editing protein [Actinomycetota bacterium]
MTATEQLYLDDAYLRSFSARVVDVRDGTDIALDRTAFYPTGGGQPYDTGTLGDRRVVAVRKEGGQVWHVLDGPGPGVGEEISGEVDWDRRHALMRTHTALHVLCGVIWNRWQVPVTGGNMEPLGARMDFEFDPLPEGFGGLVEDLVNVELEAARPVKVEWVPRTDAFADADLIRTKVSLIPEGVDPIRVIDIVGLDKQADGGLHVRSTDEVGRVRVTKTESKGKGNKRVRLQILDPD